MNKKDEPIRKAIYPSFITSTLTVRTFLVPMPGSLSVSIFGKGSAGYERTLNCACKTIWYFSRLEFLLFFNEPEAHKPITELKKEDEMRRVVVIGCDVIKTLNVTYLYYQINSKIGYDI